MVRRQLIPRDDLLRQHQRSSRYGNLYPKKRQAKDSRGCFVKTNASIRNSPIIGWKVAHSYVLLAKPDVLRFSPLSFRNTTYGAEDRALCHGHRHVSSAPHLRCACGFNAWDNEETSIRYMIEAQKVHDFRSRTVLPELRERDANWVMLRVALFGRVIEGTMSATNVDDFGYRASNQRVLDVFFDEQCVVCGNQTTQLMALGTETFSPFFAGNCRRLRPLCAMHLDETHTILDPAILERHNNVKIHWGYPTSR